MAVIKNNKTGMWEVRTYHKDLTGERKQNAGLSCRGIPGVLQSFVWNYEKGKTFSVYQIAYGTLYGYSCSLQYAFNRV